MLSKELKEKYKKKTLPVRKGDKVKIMRGQFKGKIGTVEKVSAKLTKVYVQNIGRQKRDGSKSFYPLHPSNIMITEIIEDKKRTGIKNGKKPLKKNSNE